MKTLCAYIALSSSSSSSSFRDWGVVSSQVQMFSVFRPVAKPKIVILVFVLHCWYWKFAIILIYWSVHDSVQAYLSNVDTLRTQLRQFFLPKELDDWLIIQRSGLHSRWFRCIKFVVRALVDACGTGQDAKLAVCIETAGARVAFHAGGDSVACWRLQLLRGTCITSSILMMISASSAYRHTLYSRSFITTDC